MILASGSPRRIEILERCGFDVDARPQDVDEAPLAGEHPQRLVERLARKKAESAARACDPSERGELVVAADTIVWLDGVSLGKPSDAEDAARMLRELSDRTHHVSTGVCLGLVGDVPGRLYKERSFVETADVSFYPLSDEEIDAYVATAEPLDKAGAYGYQGLGCTLVRGITGDYYTVVGLPIARLVREASDVTGHLVRFYRKEGF